VSPVSPNDYLDSPSHGLQREPIDPSRVVCLGPLPNNIQVPRHSASIPQIITPDGRMIAPRISTGSQHSASPPASPERTRSHRGHGTNESLGSNYTVDEEHQIHEDIMRQTSMHRPQLSTGDGTGNRTEGDDDDDYPHSPQSMERIEAGEELVHVPQVAPQRYSWEEERSP
jgi:hypothetical protein